MHATRPLLAVLLLFAVGAAAAECTPIDRVPVAIFEPGSYCLTRSHAVDMADHRAIDIASDDVTLDFAGHTIRNLRGSGNKAVGVFSMDHRNVTVRGGTVAGFRTGVALDHSGSGCTLGVAGEYRVEDMSVSDSLRSGIYLHGCSLEARRNRVWNTGTDTRLPAQGIYAIGAAISIVDNDVRRVVGSKGDGAGILVDWNAGAGVVEGNRVTGVPQGIHAPGAVAFRDNTVMEAASNAYVGGTDAGGNH